MFISKYAQITLSAALLLTASACQTETSAPNVSAPNANQDKSSVSRVDTLMADMTLDEKLAQISCVWFGKADILNSDGSLNPEKMKEKFPHGVGCFARPQDTIGMEADAERKDVNDSTVVRTLKARTPSETVTFVNSVQKWMMEETRQGIPTLFHEEGLHGFQGRYATSFPQSIALASTFDPDLVQQVFSVTAREIRARGVHHVLSPVVDVALDARWGRIEETYGEDPYLVSKMGLAAVKGFQGEGFPIADDKVLTTLKHMTGHGQPESGMNIGPANISERTLREVFFPPFEAAIKEGNAASVMASYNEINGVPSHANDWLLNDILRGEWGFMGAVVADYFAINELNVRHSIAKDISEAGELALKAGVDMELPDGVAYYALKDKIETGEFDVKYVDQAVKRVLEMKVRGNVFDTPFADGAAADAITGNEEARILAAKAARKSAVLVKNDGQLLPLDKTKYKKIAVIGPNAAITVLGGYSDEPRQTISILDGIKAEIGNAAEVTHAQGVTLTTNRDWWDDDVKLADKDKNMASIYEAVALAKTADLIILAIGGDESTSREAWSETHMGDRPDITLIGQQKELVEALANTGTSMVTVMITGRPLAITNVEDKMPAILWGWQLGQETGTAVADLLFGKANPGGKMPVSIPRSVGHVPAFYNYKPTARRGYAFNDVSPLYPFGFGLSYTTFDISEPVLSESTIGIDGTTNVSVTVTNTGEHVGDEVVQLYIRDKVSSVTRPVKELKGFERLTLKPGETQTVTLPITPKSLWFWDINMERRVEPGEFDIMVGNSSDNVKSVMLTVQ